MKTETSPSTSTPEPALPKGDTAKLVSLLALASGAVAMPQTSNADIIYTNLYAAPVQVGFTGSDQFIIDSLPGGASVRFFREVRATTTPFTMTDNLVRVAGGSGRRYVGFKHNASGFAAVTQAGQIWNQLPGGALTGATMGLATSFGLHSPAPYGNDKYLAFEFFDTTHGGRATFGWINVSLSYTGLGPDVTIYGYAYDNLGNQIPMGAGVPEPNSMALLALGALALGASGVRHWRRNRPSAGQA